MLKMMTLQLILFTSLGLGAGSLWAKGETRKPTQKAYTYSEEQKMSLDKCLQRLINFAKEKEMKLEMWEPAGFYIHDKAGELYGNGSYSEGTCSIILF